MISPNKKAMEIHGLFIRVKKTLNTPQPNILTICLQYGDFMLIFPQFFKTSTHIKYNPLNNFRL